MNETLEVTKKPETQVSEQIGRIATKLAERAAKLPDDVKNEGDPTAGFSTYHTGGENAAFDLASNKGPNYSSVNKLPVSPTEGYTNVDRGDSETDTTIVADGGRVFAHSERIYSSGSSNSTVSHELSQEQAVHEAAKAFNDLRGEIAAREIESDKR
jgi:hypothetical protein